MVTTNRRRVGGPALGFGDNSGWRPDAIGRAQLTVWNDAQIARHGGVSRLIDAVVGREGVLGPH